MHHMDNVEHILPWRIVSGGRHSWDETYCSCTRNMAYVGYRTWIYKSPGNHRFDSHVDWLRRFVNSSGLIMREQLHVCLGILARVGRSRSITLMRQRQYSRWRMQIQLLPNPQMSKQTTDSHKKCEVLNAEVTGATVRWYPSKEVDLLKLWAKTKVAIGTEYALIQGLRKWQLSAPS